MTNFDAASLTDEHLGLCLEELRKRGYAVAVYGAQELFDGPLSNEDSDTAEVMATAKKFLADHREYLEDAMFKGVWDYCENEDAIT